MFPITTARRRNLDSLVAQAMCGVIKQFLAWKSGWSIGGGSMAKTSIPAPRIRSSFSASASACASINPPREVLIINAEGFIKASDWALIRCSVCGVNGQCKLTISACDKSSSCSSAHRKFLR